MSEQTGIWVKMDVGIRSGILRQLRQYGGSVYAVWMCLGSHVGDKGYCIRRAREEELINDSAWLCQAGK